MESKPKEQFVLIGAGLARTGTNSTQVALQMLLKGKCYHMMEVFKHGSRHSNFWAEVISGGRSVDEIGDFLVSEGYVSGVDDPIAPYFKDLMKQFPNAKVLLTVRDDGHKWYKSVRDTIYYHFVDSHRFPTSIFSKTDNRWEPLFFIGPDGKSRPDTGLLGSVGAGEESAVKFYDEWNAEVKRHVPPEKLLVFNVKEGWAPLCKFLNVPVPDVPFPNVNDSSSMKNRRRKLLLKSWGLVLTVPVVLGGAGYFAWKFLTSSK
mmetsp:Transcript_45578/g.52484  ORF Transcript_45578/g.52484 Transcript_45578/m.52484 type:complete len:261 (-) Transcript_45578:195-977(-)